MVDRRLEEVGRTAGFTVPDPCSMAGQSWLERRIRMIEEDSAQHPWLNRAVVRKEDNQMVGNISFHHKAPDPTCSGTRKWRPSSDTPSRHPIAGTVTPLRVRLG